MPSPTRLFQAMPLVPNQSIRLDTRAAHHIARVLRAVQGRALTLFNGQGGEYPAVITHIDKKGVEVHITDFLAVERESPIEIWLAQGISRNEKMDMIIQKAVELGVNHFIPLVTDRCNARKNRDQEIKRLEHWKGIIISACEQSGRNRVPALSPPLTLEEWLPMVKAEARSVLSPHVQQTFSTGQWNAQPLSFALLIGPEGGLTEQEVTLSSQYDFIPFNLGSRILRTETAAITAVSVLQYQYGDLSVE